MIFVSARAAVGWPRGVHFVLGILQGVDEIAVELFEPLPGIEVGGQVLTVRRLTA